jgi:hypothetical protein
VSAEKLAVAGVAEDRMVGLEFLAIVAEELVAAGVAEHLIGAGVAVESVVLYVTRYLDITVTAVHVVEAVPVQTMVMCRSRPSHLPVLAGDQL